MSTLWTDDDSLSLTPQVSFLLADRSYTKKPDVNDDSVLLGMMGSSFSPCSDVVVRVSVMKAFGGRLRLSTKPTATIEAFLSSLKNTPP